MREQPAPASDGPAFTNSRRLRPRRSCHTSLGGAVDRGPDALIGAAAADVPGHGGVDVGVGRVGIAGEQAAADMICPDWQ